MFFLKSCQAPDCHHCEICGVLGHNALCATGSCNQEKKIIYSVCWLRGDLCDRYKLIDYCRILYEFRLKVLCI